MEEIPLYAIPRYSNESKIYRKRVNWAWKQFMGESDKTERLIKRPASEIFNLCADVYMSTTSQWKKVVEYYTKLEEYDACNIVVRDDTHIRWWNFNEVKQTYTVLHCMVDENDPHYVGYWIQDIKGNGHCFVYTNQSSQDLDILENTHVVYANWRCKNCKAVSKPSDLVCCHCHSPRYWKCNLCELPQLERDESCWKCRTKKYLNN